MPSFASPFAQLRASPDAISNLCSAMPPYSPLCFGYREARAKACQCWCWCSGPGLSPVLSRLDLTAISLLHTWPIAPSRNLYRSTETGPQRCAVYFFFISLIHDLTCAPRILGRSVVLGTTHLVVLTASDLFVLAQKSTGAMWIACLFFFSSLPFTQR